MKSTIIFQFLFVQKITFLFNCPQYSDCECINHNETLPDVTQNRLSFFSSAASIGYCTLECDAFWIYMILFSVCVFVHSTSEVGSMMLTIRCVDTKDKAMALGLIQFAIGLFGQFIHLFKFQISNRIKLSQFLTVLLFTC